MSQISQKSISGITSITTPTGIDNQFTLHTNDTSQAAKLDNAGNFHFSNHVNTTGITSASNFKTGSSNLHSTGLNVGNTFVHSTGINGSSADIDDFISVGNNIHLGNAGVVTATSFVGSGAALTGIDATSIKDSGGNVKVQAQASGAMYTGIHTFSSGAEIGSNIKFGNAGVVTATSFVGNGAALTGIDATAIKDSGGNVKIQAQASGAVYTGIHTFTALTVSGGNVPVAITHTGADGLTITRSSKAFGINANHGASNTHSAINVSSGMALRFQTNGTDRVQMDSSGNWTPTSDNARNLGTSSLRWANIYSADIHCSNKGSSNDVDGTWGDFTIQEGESDLFLINNRSGKKYKFNLTEVN